MNEVMMQHDGGMMSHNTQTEMMISRQAQEVQAAMVIAKRFPRDEVESYNRIIQSCKRKSLAESAMYEYPRGATKVTGPSIRLAEAIAQNWGNIDFGITELEQKNGESQVMAYAWDLETNSRQVKIFSVPHVRSTKKGNVPLTDPRDIYEMVANQGARRLRSCILGIIPGDVVEAAVKECQKTLVSGNEKPLIDRVRDGIRLFEEKFSVTQEMIEKYIGCKCEAFSENDMFKAELDMITAGDFTSWNFIMRYNNRQSNDVLFLTSSENKEYCLAKAAGIVDDIYRQMDDKSALYLKQVMKEAIRYNESIIS